MAGAVSPARRAKAARVRRQGGTQQAAADAARVDVSTVQRWEKTPGFQDLLHSRGILAAGPLKILADDGDALDEIDADESVMWIAGDEILGTLVVRGDSGELRPLARVVFVPPAEVQVVRDALAEHRFPLLPDAPSTVCASSVLTALQDAEELQRLTTICTASESDAFRAFLGLWRYRSQEMKEVRTLGDELWPAQEQLIDAIIDSPALMILKARKLGLSTV